MYPSSTCVTDSVPFQRLTSIPCRRDSARTLITWVGALTVTLLIDTGNAIALCGQNMTDSAAQVALKLAKEKFRSTLTIKDSKAFKAPIIDFLTKIV